MKASRLRLLILLTLKLNSTKNVKTLITRIEVRIMRLKGRRVKRQRVRCKPPDDVQPDVPNNNTGIILSIIPVIILSIIPVIILVIIYYSSSIENTTSIIYYCTTTVRIL